MNIQPFDVPIPRWVYVNKDGLPCLPSVDTIPRLLTPRELKILKQTEAEQPSRSLGDQLWKVRAAVMAGKYRNVWR